MKAKFARLIRIGIFSRCIPYKTNREPDPVFGGHFTILDLTRLQNYQDEWILNSHIPLVQEAHDRTKPWTSQRYT